MAEPRLPALAWLRLDVVKLLLLALPALLLNQLLLNVAPPAGERPWSAAVALLPLAVAAWFLWRLPRRRRPVALGNGYLAFFLLYCLAFSVLAGSRLLDGPRRLLAGYEEATPRNFLALGRLGDWHYAVAPPAPPASDLLAVTFPSFAGKTREEVRLDLARLLRQVVDHEAKGVAFDVFLEQESAIDPLLRREIAAAEAAGVPVILGFRHAERDGMVVRRPLAPSLAGAVPGERQGHLSGYLELDGRVRMVPVELPGVAGYKSLAWRVAEVLAARPLAAPESGLVQPLEPEGGVRTVPFAPDAPWELVRDRFVLVGTGAASDERLTPFGAVPGVVIHAWTAHALRTGHFVHHLDPRWTFPVIFALCYVLTVMAVRGVATRRILLAAAGFAAAVVAVAALAMRFGLLWMDVSYPLVAVGLYAGLLLVGRALGRSRQPTATAETPPTSDDAEGDGEDENEDALPPADGGGDFDVFLSHNSRDKPAVRQLADALVARRLRPWLDERELVPGRPWQEGLEEIIACVRSSAVLVGGDGLGPWEVPEMRASLSECVRRGLPVIPVLLPGAPARPVLPLFLTQFTWVDLRGGLSDEGLDRLEWGITGVKPHRA